MKIQNAMILLLQQTWEKPACLLANVVKMRKAKGRMCKHGKLPQMQNNGWQTWNSQGRKQETEQIAIELWKSWYCTAKNRWETRWCCAVKSCSIPKGSHAERKSLQLPNQKMKHLKTMTWLYWPLDF